MTSSILTLCAKWLVRRDGIMLGMPLLLDVTCLCEHRTDDALDYIYKSMSEPPGDDGGIWDEHPSPFVRRLVELFTSRGLARLDGMRDELAKWLAGEMHEAAGERAPRPPAAMQRWSRAELEVAKLYLETLPTAEFQLDDWMMLVDYVVQRYLPEADLRSEAEWLSTRANLMGRVAAALDGEIEPEQADHVLMALPSNASGAAAQFTMTPEQIAILEYGNARCVENVIGLTDAIRHRMRRLVMDYTEAQILGDKAKTAESLQTQLLDEFGTMNRDWRRIAVTEAGENLNQGFIASTLPGTRVKRVEKYRGACEFCRKIDGKIVTVVDAFKPDKDGETEIWAGKTNVGRSASPRKREGGRLVDREPKERWWIATGVQHPHCRGGWVKLAEGSLPVDPKFSEWMDQVLGRK